MDLPSIKFHFNGEDREYTLVYDYNKFCEVEAETGLNMLAAMGPGRTMSGLRAMLYALLKTTNPKILLSEAGDMLSRDMEDVGNCVNALIATAIGIEEDQDGTTPAPPEPAVEAKA